MEIFMKSLISARLAGKIMVALLILLSIFHVLILSGVFSLGNVWGGQLEDGSQNAMTMEFASLIVTLIFLAIVAMKAGYLKAGKSGKAVRFGLWIMSGYFVLNTIGNLASGVAVENMVFAPLTIIMALLTFRLALDKESI
jgi:hypothetical protein